MATNFGAKHAAIIAACYMQKLHTPNAHETTSKIIVPLLHKNCM